MKVNSTEDIFFAWEYSNNFSTLHVLGGSVMPQLKLYNTYT